MQNVQELHELLTGMKLLKKCFDTARIVDPLHKTLFQLRKENGQEILEKQQNLSCYAMWQKNNSCLNCVSMRAINENETFVKFEEIDGRIFMLTAVPIEVEGRRLAIELSKDITHQKILDGMLNKDIETMDKELLRSSIARLNEIVVRDTLTQLYNRKYINEKLPVDLMKAYVEKICVSVIIADIDHFKTVNDTYGHLVGDQILQRFAQILQQNIRQTSGDWVARYGGEEFLICLIGGDKQSAVATVERIRKAVEIESYNTTAGALSITASFGMKTIVNQEIDMLEFIQLADKNLYVAKNSGRNCVMAG